MIIETMLQQGEVNIVKVKDEDEAIRKRTTSEEEAYYQIQDGVVRAGSSTGHSHRIVGTEFYLAKDGLPVNDRVALIVSDDCEMVHEEHKTIKLEPGCYRFSATFEYDHFANKGRFVVD